MLKARIQSETEELEGEIALLTEQLEILSDPVKHERLSSKASALFARFLQFPQSIQTFSKPTQALSETLETKQPPPTTSLKISKSLQHNVEVLKKNGEHLEGQREHMKSMLEQPLSARNLARLERHHRQLVGHFEQHTKSVENFNQSTTDFVAFIDSLSENKKAAQLNARTSTQPRPQMLAQLDQILEADFDGSPLQDAYAKAQRNVGDQVLEFKRVHPKSRSAPAQSQ